MALFAEDRRRAWAAETVGSRSGHSLVEDNKMEMDAR